MKRSDTLASVVISSDEAFRSALQEYRPAGGGHDLSFVLEYDLPYSRVSDAQMKQIKLARPRLVFLDLDVEPDLGFDLARYLIDALPETRLIGAGTDGSGERLMAALQAGFIEYLMKPVEGADLDAAMLRVERKLGTVSGEKTPGKVLAFLGAKGGAGATTIATNVAIQLHRQTSDSVLLVDLDLELGEVALFLNLDPRYSVVDLAENFHRLDDGLLESLVARHSSGIHVLTAPYVPDQADGLTGDQVRRVLRFLKKRYDWIVVDASNSLAPRTRSALEEADELYLVTQVDVPSVRNIQRAKPILDRMTKNKPLKLVVNRFDPKGADITLKDIEETVGLPIHWTLSSDYDTVVYSINAGEPLALAVPTACARELEGMVAQLTGKTVEKPKKTGFLTRVFARRKRRAAERPVPSGRLAGEAGIGLDSVPPLAAGGEG